MLNFLRRNPQPAPVAVGPTATLLPSNTDVQYTLKTVLQDGHVTVTLVATAAYKAHSDGSSANVSSATEIPCTPELEVALKQFLANNQASVETKFRVAMSESILAAARRGEL